MNSAQLLSDKILQQALKSQATDIHFYPFTQNTNIYFRIQGKRILHTTISTVEYELLLTYYKFTSGMDIGEIRKPQNGTIPYQTNSQDYSLRLSTLPVNQLESLAMRILPQGKHFSLDQLFLFKNQLTKIKQWMNFRAGLILISGPTGSGKTTTLYALLEETLKNGSFQTITLEDPIEKNIDDILQVQVNEKAGITYQTGLKAALRHDPDIIMVGEIRDRHTAKFALEASLTGHLVLSTIHAKNTIGTIQRLLEMGLTRVELEQSLIGISSIQLIPIISSNESKRRAALLEILDGKLLSKAIQGENINFNHYKHTFFYLKRKAWSYGFISNETFEKE
ncbi:competence type IV pilus ATPase ComGA [Ornithinibacillus halotolerans]|uniref:Competence protein ComG n=1 Tax=Ornithinibacillus halotolerans TaxID=1274357 RepID=A0A916RUS0_9BACI|nr:competence type IV pilus ATPase ComGA [Ornithinibacillus halotolerans]GGA68295.1 competence protein ComG [Ornithinibacillus halotolerans]